MRVLNRFRVGTKITGILLVLLVTALVGASGLYYLNQMNNRLNAIVDRSVDKVKLAAYLSRDLGDVVRAEKNTILAPDPAGVRQWADTTDELLAKVAEHQARLQALVDAEGSALLARFDGHWQTYLAHHRQVRDLVAAGDLEEAAALSAGAAWGAVALATADMDALVVKNEADMDAAKLAAEASFGQARDLVLGFTALALAGGLALGFAVSRSISSNLGVMVHAAGGIADGDVGQEVAVESRDEIGDLAVAFGRMIAYLKEMAGVATRVANGDVEVQVTPRSAQDTLSLALGQMVSNLKEMAGVATRVASGDLEVQVTPRSERDTLGLAVRQMVADLKQAEERLSHLNAVLDAIRHVNQLIVREKDQGRLIQGACDSLIETRGFASAWIGLVDRATGAVKAVEAGLGEAFAPLAEALKRGELPPCGHEVLKQAGVVALDVSPDTCPDCPLVEPQGSRLALGARLEHDGRVYGLLVVSFPQGLALDEEERGLLGEVAADLGLGLHTIQQEGEIRQLNEELEQRVVERTAQLKAVNRELEAFAYSVSHDLRAPLRGIDGWSLALLEDYHDQLDDQARQYLDRVRSEAQRMGRLIDDLLQLSRVTRAGVQTSDVDLTALGSTVAARLRASQPERQVEVVIQSGLTARGDGRLLEVLLTNLLDNAWKFTAPRPLARVEFGRTEAEGDVAFYVRDNGVGFDMGYASKLFGAFQRMHSASEFPGTGIGLVTVQRIAHRHGGRVWAEAHVDQGATFYFTLGEAP